MESQQTYSHCVRIDWNLDDQGSIWWNEICAEVIEIFGAPGKKYLYRPYIDYMSFEFASEKDALLCKLLLSDRL